MEVKHLPRGHTDDWGRGVFWHILLPADFLEQVPQKKFSMFFLDFSPEGRACPRLLNLPGNRNMSLTTQL